MSFDLGTAVSAIRFAEVKPGNYYFRVYAHTGNGMILTLADEPVRVTGAAVTNASAEELIQIAESQVGTKTGEKYWEAYFGTRFRNGNSTPWCGTFVSWCFDQAGLSDRIEDVERFAKDALYVHRDDAIPLAAGGYYVADLIGLSVFDEEDTEVGTLTDVIETGANDVYEVRLTPDYAAKNTDGARPGRMPHTVLLPATGECILQVDLEERRMRVHMLPGLV